MPQQTVTCPIECLLVDDEPYVRADLSYMLKAFPSLQVTGEAGTIEEAGQALAEHQFDVVFLDIQLKGGTGFDVLPLVPLGTQVVFVTAHEQYAVRAFDVNALDYLVKPVVETRLAATVERIVASMAGQQMPTPPARLNAYKRTDKILLQSRDCRHMVSIDDIVFINSVGGNYTSVALKEGEHVVVRYTFKEWERMLPPGEFVRIHRQTIVNLSFVGALKKDESGTWHVHLKGMAHPLKVSRRLLLGLKETLQKFTTP